MEFSNAIEPGNSGSALVDSAGIVVGFVFATRVSNGDELAIPVSALAAFLESPGSQQSPPARSDWRRGTGSDGHVTAVGRGDPLAP
jgi:S1-C subfamily serine protease